MQLANSSGITIDSIYYYELTNYVLLLYNRVVGLCNNIISYFSYFVIHEIFVIRSIMLLCTAKEAFVK